MFEEFTESQISGQVLQKIELNKYLPLRVNTPFQSLYSAQLFTVPIYMNEYSIHMLPRRVYKTQTFKFTADTVGDQFTIHTEVR